MNSYLFPPPSSILSLSLLFFVFLFCFFNAQLASHEYNQKSWGYIKKRTSSKPVLSHQKLRWPINFLTEKLSTIHITCKICRFLPLVPKAKTRGKKLTEITGLLLLVYVLDDPHKITASIQNLTPHNI